MYVVLLAIRFYGIRYEVMMMMVVRGCKIVEVVDQLLQFLVFCIIAHGNFRLFSCAVTHETPFIAVSWRIRKPDVSLTLLSYAPSVNVNGICHHPL